MEILAKIWLLVATLCFLGACAEKQEQDRKKLLDCPSCRLPAPDPELKPCEDCDSNVVPASMMVPQGFKLTIETYTSCDELQATVHDQWAKAYARYIEDQKREEQWRDDIVMERVQDGAAPESAAEAPMDVEASGGTSTDQVTNIQEAGVDEADMVKVTDQYLYVMRRNGIEVIRRGTLHHQGSIDLTQRLAPESQLALSSPVTTSEWSNNSQREVTLYATNNRLTALIPSANSNKTIALTFEDRPDAMPELVHEQQFHGRLVESRMTGGYVYLVLSLRLPLREGFGYQSVPGEPVLVENDAVAGIACTKIAKQKAPDTDLRLTHVVSIPTSDPTKIQKSAILGGGDQIYMTQRSLYVVKQGWSLNTWTMGEHFPLIVSKFTLTDDGAIHLAADGIIEGQVKNSFHFKEIADGEGLAVATTFPMFSNPTLPPEESPLQTIGDGMNRFYVLKQDGDHLTVQTGLSGLGKPGEDIRSVRYADGYAYLVTFKKTDPLYAINIQDPWNPRLEGELEIPGFSMYMHQIADGRMVGVGFDAQDHGNFALYQGIQVSLFDVSDQKNLKRLDNRIHGARGSSSDVTSDHHAFFHDRETGTFFVPVVELVTPPGPRSWERQLAFSGAVAYDLVDDKLQEKGRLSHKDIIPPECDRQLSQDKWWEDETRSLDINRVIKIDGKLTSISRFGVKTHGDDLQTTHTVTFQNPEECRRIVPIWPNDD